MLSQWKHTEQTRTDTGTERAFSTRESSSTSQRSSLNSENFKTFAINWEFFTAWLCEWDFYVVMLEHNFLLLHFRWLHKNVRATTPFPCIMLCAYFFGCSRRGFHCHLQCPCWVKRTHTHPTHNQLLYTCTSSRKLQQGANQQQAFT